MSSASSTHSIAALAKTGTDPSSNRTQPLLKSRTPMIRAALEPSPWLYSYVATAAGPCASSVSAFAHPNSAMTDAAARPTRGSRR